MRLSSKFYCADHAVQVWLPWGSVSASLHLKREQVINDGDKIAIAAGDQVVSRGVEWCMTRSQKAYRTGSGGPFPLIMAVDVTTLRSLESNSVAESFVQTFQQDDVYVNDLPSAVSMMQRIIRLLILCHMSDRSTFAPGAAPLPNRSIHFM